MIREFAARLHAYDRGDEGSGARLGEIARDYAEFLENHIMLENTEAFPLAEQVLTEEDWVEINAAFLDNDDPIVGGPEREKYAALHKRIVGLGLPPMGMPRK